MRLDRRFLRALGYFTIVPVDGGIGGPPEPADVAMLPLVGACVGLAAGSIAYASSFVVPRRVATAIAYAVPIVLTGALHLDGFLDICDAALASVDVEKRREILRDPRHGSYAFAGGSILAILGCASLREIEPRSWPVALALAGGVSRIGALVAASCNETPGARGTAAGAFADKPKTFFVAAQALFAIAEAYRQRNARGAVGTIAILAATAPLSRAIARRFDNSLGGDAYGFIISVTDVATLMLLPADA